MKFLFHCWNHSDAGQRSLEDPIRIVSHQLRELGHYTIWDRDNDAAFANKIQFCHGPDEWNIIVEGFTPDIVNLIRNAQRETGARFLCLATEEPVPGKGFNHGTQKEMVARQEIFPEAMKYFDGILHLVPGKPVTDWYSQFAPAAYAELGYAKNLIRPQRNMNPEYDFGFYGSLTKRRLNLLKRLTKRIGTPKAVRIVADFANDDERDAAMQNAKVILQVRKFEEMGLVSSSRCNTALCLGRPVVAEPHDTSLTKAWEDVVKFTATEEEFIQTAILTSRRWRDAHHFQMEKFKAKLTPEFCIGASLASLRLGEKRKKAA